MPLKSDLDVKYGLCKKSSCSAPALGGTQLITIVVMNLATLIVLLMSDLDVKSSLFKKSSCLAPALGGN